MNVKSISAAMALVICAGVAASQTEWINTSGGNWNLASNWNPADVPNSLTEQAILGDLGLPYVVALDIGTSILGFEISTNATLNLNAGLVVSVAEQGIVNNGLLVINTSGSTVNATLRSLAPATLSGTGRTELNALSTDLNDAALQGLSGATLTIAAEHLVAGSGIVIGPVSLLGTIDADRDGLSIRLGGTIDATGGGMARGTNNGSILLAGTYVGGNLGGHVQAEGGVAQINGSTSTNDNSVLAGATLNLVGGGLINNGTWLVNTTGSTVNATMRTLEPATIDGSGAIELNALSPDLNDAKLGGLSGATLTIGTQQTVRGSGVLEGPVHIMGTVDADRLDRDLSLTGSHTSGPNAVIRGSNGGIAVLVGNLTGGLIDGDVHASGNVAQLDGTTSQGTNGVRAASTLNLVNGGLHNDGVWVINTTASTSNAEMRSLTPTTISGTGRIELNTESPDLNDARLSGLVAAPLTIGADQSVTGSGALAGPVVLLGTVDADRDGRDLVVQGTIDATGGGRLRGSNGGTTALSGQLTGGSLEGGVEAQGNSALLNGVTVTGHNGIRPSSDVFIGSAGIVNNGTIFVNTTGSASNAALRANEPTSITGTGIIELNSISPDFGDAQINTSVLANIEIGPEQAITGSGLVAGSYALAGSVIADRAGRDLRVQANVDASTGGRLSGTNGGITTLVGPMVGGFWMGGVQAENAASINGTVLEGDNGIRASATLDLLAGGMTNNGHLLINVTASTTDAVLRALEPATIDGIGTIQFNAVSGDFGDARTSTTVLSSLTFDAGQTLIGRGQIGDNVTIHGTVDAGTDADQTGFFHYPGPALMTDSTLLKFDIAGTALDDFDRATVGPPGMTLDGTLEIELIDGFVPAFNTRFTLISGSNITGQPHTVVSPEVGLGVFRLIISPTKVEAVWTCQADINGDGVLDFFDVQFFLNAFTAQALYGDYNDDGINDFFDVQAFLNDFSLGCL
jgi:hypothetical protein